jgi:tetratricopeptide (TPR) repeat protein
MRHARRLFPVAICLLNIVWVTAALSIAVIAQPQAGDGAQQQSVTPEMRNRAGELYQNRDWAGAAQAYEIITRLEPANAGAWSRRGLALHSLGKHQEAIEAFTRSLEINNQQPLTFFNLARAHARLNDKGRAFETLTKALDAGFSQTQMLETDEDIAALRTDPRFKELTARAAVNAKPCAARAEHRQLDYWIGEWDVKSTAQNQAAGTSSIQLILGDCVVLENWTGASGTNGKSFNFFNSATGRWQQTWVDDKGGLLEFTGSYKDGAMHYAATTTIKGRKVLQRMTLFNLSATEMRQLGEQSTDEGKTWSVMYDLTYHRRKAST